MRRRSLMRLGGILLLSGGLLACGERRAEVDPTPQYSRHGKVDTPVYVLAIHPLHNPARLFEVYGPLVDHLNRQIPAVTFVLEASRNYEEFERKLFLRQVAFALPIPTKPCELRGMAITSSPRWAMTPSSAESSWCDATPASPR